MKNLLFICLSVILLNGAFAATTVGYVSRYYHDTYVWNGTGHTVSWLEGVRNQSSYGSRATGWISIYNGVTTGYVARPIGVINQRTWIEWTSFDLVRIEDSIELASEVSGRGSRALGVSIWLFVDEYSADPEVHGDPVLKRRNVLIGPSCGSAGGRATISVPSQSKVRSVSRSVQHSA